MFLSGINATDYYIMNANLYLDVVPMKTGAGLHAIYFGFVEFGLIFFSICS